MKKLCLLSIIAAIFIMPSLLIVFQPVELFENSEIPSNDSDCLDMERNLYQGQEDYEIFQLTHNLYTDGKPQIHNGMVTWQGKVDDNEYGVPDDWEIFLYDPTTGNTQLTYNTYEDIDPQIHGGMVTWEGRSDDNEDGHPDDWEIFLFDGEATIQLTTNDFDDHDPQIHDGMVTWEGQADDDNDGNPDDYEIFLYDGETTIQLTTNDFDDHDPQIHDGMVTWEGQADDDNDGNPDDYEIFLYDGEINQLTTNDYYDTNPQIDAGQVTWEATLWDEGDECADTDIFYYDGESTIRLTSQISSFDEIYNDMKPQIHNGLITWILMIDHVVGAYSYAIGLYDGTSSDWIWQLDWSPFFCPECEPQIHNGMVTWAFIGGLIGQIYVYDGENWEIVPQLELLSASPQIHSDIIVFTTSKASSTEIIMRASNIAPMIDHPEDLIYLKGALGEYIQWNPYDYNPAAYKITQNGEEVMSGPWSGERILIEVDGLQLGTHSYECTVYDTAGNSASDVVQVQVASQAPIWDVAPTDQVITYGEHFEYQISAKDILGVSEIGISEWWISDTTNFDLYATFYDASSTALIEAIDLAPGSYSLEVVVTDVEGYSLAGNFDVAVIEEQVELELSGNFDYLLKEDIHLQLAALLTNKQTEEPIMGATVTFDIYGPDGLVVVSGTLDEGADPGVYVYTMPETIKKYKDVFVKGIYLVYAHAVTVDDYEAVDMIQFHIDPPGVQGPNMLVILALSAFVGLLVLNSLIAGHYFWKQRRLQTGG